MPTYEYVCDACGHTFDELQGFSEEPLTKCPQCKKKKLRRLFGTGAAVLFKGSGFYETDYRSELYKTAAKAEADSSKPASDTAAPAKTDGATAATDSAPAKPSTPAKADKRKK
jgi:putative FmdB family regulatory protein